MTILCAIRAFVVGVCNCRYHVFSRRMDEWIDDWNREQASMPSPSNSHKSGVFR